MTVSPRPAPDRSSTEAPTIGPHQFVGWFFEPDDLLGWRMTPGQQAWFVKPGIRTWVSLNERGFRSRDFSPNKGPQDRRILLLGDSFGIAIEAQEEETFPGRLQQKLAQLSVNLQRKTALFNASVGGYGTEQEYLYLQKEGPELQPDIVLLAFHFGSDLIENSQELRKKIHWRIVKLPRPYLIPKVGGGLEIVNFPPDQADILRSWKHYYDFLPRNLRKQRLELNHDPRWDQDPVADQLRRLLQRMRESIYKRRQKNVLKTTVPLDAKIFYTEPDDDFEKSWQHSARLMAAIKEQTERLGAQLIVVNICTKEQIIPGFLESRLPPDAENRADYDPLYPHRRLEEILGNLHIAYIDLIPRFQNTHQAGKNLFHESDLHWNPDGHALAAEVIWHSLTAYL